MIGTVVTALLSLLQTIAPSAAGSSAITSIINTLIQILPVLIKEFNDLVPIVQNIINALKSNVDITPEQLDQLSTIEVQYDSEFEIAAAAAQAEDKKDEGN